MNICKINARHSELNSAKKRALSMGKYSAWKPEYDNHYLAACMDNRTTIIDAELEKAECDYLLIMFELLSMAKRINTFCDSNKVSGDNAAQYWLERFLWRCDVVINIDALQG